MSSSVIIGVDIGGTNIRIGAVDADGNVIGFSRFSQHLIFDNRQAGDAICQMLSDFIETQSLEGRIEAICMGFPSTINRERTRVLQSPNIAGLQNLDIVDLVKNKLNLPIIIEKDVCMVACYDIAKYNIPPEGMFLGCYIGTGLGSIILLDGQPLIGVNGAAGEWGHIPVIGKHDQCGCGNKGCLEAYAGGKYLDQLCSKAFPGIDIKRIFIDKADDVRVREYIDNVAIAIATQINILDPDHIVLGGGVLAMPGFPRAELETAIRSHTRKPLPEETLNLIFSDDEDNKGVIGATIYARNILRKNML